MRAELEKIRMKINLFSLPKILIPSLIIILIIGILIIQQDQPPTQTQFNTNRKPITTKLTPDMAFPITIGTFSRREFNFSTDTPQSGHAVYTYGGRSITFSIVQIADQKFQDVWNGNFLTVSCGDVQGQVETHEQEKIPYRYATCHGIGFWYYEFRWFNNNWIMTASISSNSGTLSTNPLFGFVDSYPY